MRGARAAVGLASAVVLVLGVAACGGDEDDDVESGTTTTAEAVTTTTAPVTATSGPAVTGRRRARVTPDTDSTLAYGDACALGSLPDCIDPDGDGQGTYLQGGADCVRRFADSPALCNDLDGDGVAGYPDSG